MKKKLNVIGRNVERLDVRDKVTGRAKYTSDLVIPDMLIAKLVRSPYAHAKIKAINKCRAEDEPGERLS